ncbi:MAG: hypothetical protein ABH844_03650 [Candidatus Omnitrophota bacterium]
MSKNAKTRCPVCGGAVEVGVYTEIGDLITCYDCDAELEIVKIEPLKVRIARNNYSEENEMLNEVEDNDEVSWDE